MVNLDETYFDPDLDPIRPRVPAWTGFSTFVPFVIDEGENILSTSIVASREDSGITYSVNSSGVTISGSFNDLFPGSYGNYVSKNSSDKIETPTTITTFDDLPDHGAVEFYNWVQNSTAFELFHYSITVETDLISEGGGNTVYVLDFTHRIDNDWFTAMFAILDHFNLDLPNLPGFVPKNQVYSQFEQGYDSNNGTFSGLNKAVTILI